MDQNTLTSTLEGLRAMCKQYEKGKEVYARGVASELLQHFLDVEERFTSNPDATEQEVIDGLRQVGKVLPLCSSQGTRAVSSFLLLHDWSLSMPCACKCSKWSDADICHCCMAKDLHAQTNSSVLSGRKGCRYSAVPHAVLQ